MDAGLSRGGEEGSNFKFEEKDRKTRDYKNAAAAPPAALPEVGIVASGAGFNGRANNLILI